MKRKRWPSVYRVILCLFGLLVLAAVFPGLVDLLYVGHFGARSASCQSNLKQLGLAIAQYEQDSDGVQPSATSTADWWREAVYPYVKSTGTYRCPDDVSRNDYSALNLPRSYASNHLGLDNGGHERGAFSAPGEPLVNLYQLEHPASTMLLTDARGEQNEEWDIISPSFLPQPDTGRELYTHVPRHVFYEHPRGTLNVLLADGHVKRLPPMKTLSPVNLWTRDNAPFTGQDLSNARAILQHAQDE